jgi:gliding motility-associated-like protein
MFKLTTINQKLVFLVVLLAMSATGNLLAFPKENKVVELTGGRIQISGINATAVNFDFSYNAVIENVSEAQGAIQGYTYYWEKTKDIHDDTSWTEIVGANNNGIDDGQVFHTVFYRRKVVDGNGAIEYSNTVTFYKLEILSHPSTTQQVVSIDGSITPLTVTHSDIDGTPTYQWYVNSKNSNVDGTPISGATSPTYTPDNSTANWGYYYVVISDERGERITSNVSGEIFVGDAVNSISQIDNNNLPLYSTLSWYTLLTGDNFDAPNDTQAQVESLDLVGDANNPMLQTQRDRILFEGSSAPEFVYYFRARHGKVPNNSSFYLGIDVNGDKIADLFVEAKTKNNDIEVSLHLPDTGDGTSPCTTSWLKEDTEPPDGESFITTYNVESGDFTTDTNLDAPDDNKIDGWVEFAISETTLIEFVNQNIDGLNITGESVITLYVFTSTSENPNGDIGGIEGDVDCSNPPTWEDLGVTVTSSVNELIELITPTINGGTFPTTEINLTGTWGGDQGGSDTLLIELNGQTYTESDPQMTININQWLLEINSSMVEAGNSYTVTATAVRGIETKTATATITVLDDNADLASLDVTETNLSLTDPSVLTYQALVGADQEQVFLTAVASSSVASITINGETYTNGSSLTLNLNSGANNYYIEVVAENQINTRTYTVVVLRGYLPLVSEIDPSTDEDGDQGSFEVVLPSQPTGDVTISLSLSDDTEAILSETVLTFTTANWNVSQTVTLTGIDDPLSEGESVRDGAQTYQITGAVSSVDELYDGGQMPTVTMSNQDTDPPGIYIDLNESETSESGISISLTIRLLSTLLTDDIELSLPLEISNGTEGSFSATQVVTSTTITLSNAQLSTTVLIYGVDDSIDDGTISYTLTSGDPQAPGDSGYDNLTAEDVADFVLSNLDDDPTLTTLSYFQDHTVYIDQDDFTIDAPLTNNTEGTFSYTISPTSIGTIDSSSRLIGVLAVGTAIITASQASSTNYTAASITATLTVLPLGNTLYWAEDQTVAYGSNSFTIPIGQTSSTGSYSYSSADETIATIDANTGAITPLNAGTVALTVVQSADETYEESTDTILLTVTPIEASITTQDLTVDYLGNQFDLMDAILSATSSGVLNFGSSNSELLSIDGSTASILGAGTVLVTVVQDASLNYSSTTATFTVRINKIAPQLVPPTDLELVYGSNDISAIVQSTSDGVLSISLSNAAIASISANPFANNEAQLQISPLEVGASTVTINQAETANYLAASTSFTITVIKAIPDLSFEDLEATFNDPNINLTASTLSTGSISFSSADPSIASIVGSSLSINSAGIVILTAQLEEDEHYQAATLTATLTVLKDDPILELADIAVAFEDPDFNLNAISNSSGAISYQIEDNSIATVSGSLVSIVGSGFTSIIVSQEESINYNAAQISATLSVGAISPEIVFDDHFATYGTASISLSYSSTSFGAISFSVEDPAVASLSGTDLVIVGAGSTALVLTQEQDQNYFGSEVTATLYVSKASPVITTTDIEVTYGDSSFELDENYISSSSNGSINYNALDPSVVSIEGTTVSNVGAGTTIVEVQQEETSNYSSATASFTIVVQKATPLIVFEDVELTYGAADLELSYSSTSTGAVTFESQNTAIAQIQQSNLSLVGTGSLIVDLTQEATANYIAASASMTLVVNKKSLEISGIKALDKVYDGSTAATLDLTGLVLNGLVSGDDVTIVVDAEFENSNVGVDKKVNLSTTYSGVDLENYIISDQLISSASISPKPIEINGASGIDKTYDGTNQIMQGTAYELIGSFVNGDDVFVVGTPLYDSAQAGNRLIIRGSVDLSGARALNYSLSWSDGSGVISPKQLSITALDDSKFVTETDPVGYNGVSYSGFVAGESEIDLNGSLIITRSNIEVDTPGLYQSVLNASGFSSTNYSINYLPGDFTIVPADALVIDVDSQSIIYSQTPSYTLQGSYFSSQLSQAVTLDPPSFDQQTGFYTLNDGIGGSVQFKLGLKSNSTSVNSTSGNINVGSYDIETTDAEVNSSSFSGAIITTGSLTVLPKSITASLVEPTKDYDGNRTLTVDKLNLEGLIEGDDLSSTFDGLYQSSNAGTNINYAISAIQLIGVDKANYELSAVSFNGTDGIINPLSLSISAQDVSKIYDGQPNENYPLTFTGFIAGEDRFNLSGALVINEPAQSAIDVGAYDFEISGFNSTNYTISYSGAQLEITKADLYIDGFKAQDKVYDGTLDAQADLSDVVYSNLIQGDEIGLSTSAAFDTVDVGSDKPVTLTHSFNGQSTANYSINTQSTTTASILKKPLYVFADDKTVNYTGSPFEDFTVTYQGFVVGETSLVLSGTIVFSGSAVSAISGGTYTIEVSGLEAQNYEIIYESGTLTIVEGDIDNDGIVDSLDDDIDGDGIINEGDSDINGDGVMDNGPDFDQDGMNDSFDTDDDNDGIADTEEPTYNTDPYNSDTDADGVIDGTELVDNTDPLVGCDLIWEHRTILEYQEAWLSLDCDGDGLINLVEIDLDTDGDGTLDIFDIDDDGDTLLTKDEGADPNNNGLNDDSTDFDLNGIPDYLEKNKLDPNAIVARDVEVFNAISPNGDGDNDYFVVRNIEKYPDNELFVMNKDGDLVERIDSYGKDGAYFYALDTNGEALPVGVYYYVLRIRQFNLERIIKGYLYINW